MNNVTENQEKPWNDFNTADPQDEYDLIPSNTIVPVRMTIKPGGYDEPTQNWDGGYATFNPKTHSVYLNCEFVILEGQFAKRKLWQLIGLHSEKGPEWHRMGRKFIRGILNSSNGLSDKDMSPEAQQKRRIAHLQELDRRCFVVKIVVKKDEHGIERNEIKSVITADHRDYQTHAACFLQHNGAMNDAVPSITQAPFSQQTATINPPTATPVSPPAVPKWTNPNHSSSQ